MKNGFMVNKQKEAIDIENIKFDEKGLIPTIVVDAETGMVLTLAYMNKESLAISMEEGRTCFWSRSRKELWRKGETSGNVQHIKSMVCDCDRDALLVYVEKEGPACHLGNESCFEFPLMDGLDGASHRGYPEAAGEADANGNFALEKLYELLKSRRDTMPEGSYTTYLFEKGRDKILKKVGEESSEVIIAAKGDEREETIYELADLVYHAMVLMVEMGISVEEVKNELKSRHVIDKKVKQEKMV